MHVTFVPLTKGQAPQCERYYRKSEEAGSVAGCLLRVHVSTVSELLSWRSRCANRTYTYDRTGIQELYQRNSQMAKLADKVEALLNGVNLLNGKSRLEQLVPLVKDLLLRFGKMKTQLDSIRKHSPQLWKKMSS